MVVQPDVLLGNFIALLAVRRPTSTGQGLVRALVAHVAQQTLKRRRWLYTSSDSSNRPAATFYRKLGFTKIGRIPDLVSPGHVELLWRLARPDPTVSECPSARSQSI